MNIMRKETSIMRLHVNMIVLQVFDTSSLFTQPDGVDTSRLHTGPYVEPTSSSSLRESSRSKTRWTFIKLSVRPSAERSEDVWATCVLVQTTCPSCWSCEVLVKISFVLQCDSVTWWRAALNKVKLRPVCVCVRRVQEEHFYSRRVKGDSVEMLLLWGCSLVSSFLPGPKNK